MLKAIIIFGDRGLDFREPVVETQKESLLFISGSLNRNRL